MQHYSTMKKEQTTGTCNMDKPQTHDAEQKKPGTEVLIL